MTRLICRRTRLGRRERDLVQQGMGISKERVGRREASNIKGPRERGHLQRERASAKGGSAQRGSAQRGSAQRGSAQSRVTVVSDLGEGVSWADLSVV